MADLKPFEGKLDEATPAHGLAAFKGVLDGEKASTSAGDVGKSLVQGLAEGVGFPLELGGNLLAQGINRGARALGFNDPQLRAVNPLQGVIDYLDETKTAGGRQAVEQSQPKGDVFQPSTWSLGEDPSVGGYMQNVARVVGQFGLPVGIAAGGRLLKAGEKAMDVAGAVSGAAQAGGAALDQEGREIRAMPEAKLRTTSPRYMQYMEQGLDPATARERVAQDVELATGTIGAIPAAIEGPVVQRLLRGKALLPTVGKTAATRVATAGASGAVGEGIQETAEQMAQNIGARVGSGEDRSITEDTFGNALLGAAGGHLAGSTIQAAHEVAGKPVATEPPLTAEKSSKEAPKLFPFQSETAAAKRAENKTETTGEPYVVVPHPEREGRFAVVPQSELAKFTPEATDAMLGTMEKQGRRDVADLRDFTAPRARGHPEPPVADPSLIVASVNASRKRKLGETEEALVRRIADGDFGEVQGMTVDDLVGRGVKRGTAIALLSPVQKAMKGTLARQQQPASQVDLEAHEAASSPLNDKPEATKKEILAGNAELGHPRVGGMALSIENPAGSVREDKHNEPPQWRRQMEGVHYGYAKGTVAYDSTQAKPQQLDVMVKENTPPDWQGTVYTVNQNKPNGVFDEHKSLIGFDSEEEARDAYLRQYDDGQENNIRSIAALPLEEFKAWAYSKGEKGPMGGPLEPTVKEGSDARAVENTPEPTGRAVGAAPVPSPASGGVHARAAVEGAGPAISSEAAGESKAAAEVARAKVSRETVQLARRAETAFQQAPADIKTFVQNIGKSMGYALRHGTTWEAAEASERATRRQHEVNAALPYLREKLGIAKPGTGEEGAAKETSIGTNPKGHPLYEDKNGVRSYVEGGVRVTEAVAVHPGGGFSIERRSNEYKTKAELEEAAGNKAKDTENERRVAAADAIARGETLTPEQLAEFPKLADLANAKDAIAQAKATKAAEREAQAPVAKTAAAAPSTAVVPKQQLFVQAAGKRYEVESLEDASRKWDEVRQAIIKAGGGARDVGHTGPVIVDQDGKEVGRISWNGKVWPPGEWKPGDKPLVGEPFKSTLPPVETLENKATEPPVESKIEAVGGPENDAQADAGHDRAGAQVERTRKARRVAKGGDSQGLLGFEGEGRDSGNRGSGEPARPSRAPSGQPVLGDRASLDRGQEESRGSRDRTRDRVLNYRIAEGELTRVGGWREAARRNLDIIELVKKLETEKRQATREEQALLVKYTGWGASELAQNLFPENTDYAKPEWRELAERAAALFTPEELKTAKRSTQYAHYTSEGVIRGIYKGLDRMGFTGGRVLEPGAGIGLFAGLMPEPMANASHYTAIEMDHVTAAIAKQLFPAENVLQADYVRQKLPNNFFDAAIGNPPFAKTVIVDDPAYKKYRFSLHDYFFAKTIDKVRPGGLLVFVTSRYTMDKGDSKARQFIADRADLLGAIRLPQTAFKKNAGTEVVTDVLFLKKREEGAPPGGAAWLSQGDVKVGETQQLINEYFVAHPEMVLGQHILERGMHHAEEYSVAPREGESIEDGFAKAVEALPARVYSTHRSGDSSTIKAATIERDFNPKVRKEGNLYVSDSGALMIVDNGSGVPVSAHIEKRLTPVETKWLTGYVGLRDTIKAALHDQLTDGDWERSLKALQKSYDAFTKEHGPVLDHTRYERTSTDEDGTETPAVYYRFKNDKLLKLDIEDALVRALEKIRDDGTIEKGPFLLGRVVKKPSRPAIKTTYDAVGVALDERGKLDLDYIAGLVGKTRAQVIEDLGDLVYEAPATGWQMADEYLSGDVLAKLEEAEASAKVDPKFERNVQALIKVQPKPLAPADITVGLGSPWIPPEHLSNFADEVLGIPATMRYSESAAVWHIQESKSRSSRGMSEWGTPDRSAAELFEAALNNRTVKVDRVTYDGETKKTETDPEATAAANEKVKRIKEAFRSWVWTDSARADNLSTLYNRRFNNLAPRKFDGSHLTLPGASLRFKLHPHQKRAIWRIIQSGDTYLAHAVGAGKTMEMIAAGMEQRRLGLIRRPLYAVPNHMLGQFAREFLELYPTANIMVADEDNFHTANRRRFVARAAMNDPDAIILTHSALGLIDAKQESKEEVLSEIVDDLKAAMEEETDKRLVKRIEQRIEAVERRFLGRTDGAKKDQVITFEQMGVDFMFVDEAHEFRKLDFATNRNNVKGISPMGSMRSIDLFIKSRILHKEHKGRSLVMASGTPITNTMAELYTVMRFFAPEAMEADGIGAFDAWANQFGEVVPGFEQNAAGKYEIVERFSKFVNVPELMKRVRSFMDVLTSSQLGALVDLPDVKGGGREIVVVPATRALKNYQTLELQPRIDAARKWKPTRDEPYNPDPIINIITDGRLASIDMRFVYPSAKSDPDSKLNQMIDRIIETHHRSADWKYVDPATGKPEGGKGAAQIVFSNAGFGAQVAKNRGFDARGWVMQRLKEAGVPSSQVAWRADYDTTAKKETLFKEMRTGAKRVLIGSAKNMGTGLNVQRRLFALHYMDPPWFPSDLEQPEGRIKRQGNLHKNMGIPVELSGYATKGSYDSTMWSMVARKSRFIEQAFLGDDSVRKIEDISESSQYELAAALAAGDERAIQLAGFRADVERLTRLAGAHSQEQNDLRGKKRVLSADLKHSQGNLARLEAVAKDAPYISTDNFSGTVAAKRFTKRAEWGEAVIGMVNASQDRLLGVKESIEIPLARLADKYAIVLRAAEDRGSVRIDLGEGLNYMLEDAADIWKGGIDPGGLATRAINKVNGLGAAVREEERHVESLTADLKMVEKRLGAPFEFAQELADKVSETARLERELTSEGTEGAAIAAMSDSMLQAFVDQWEAEGGRAVDTEPALEEAEEAAPPKEHRAFRRPDDEAPLAAGLSTSEVQSAVRPLTAGWANAPRTVVHASTSDVSFKVSADAAGAFYKGEVHLFAENITSREQAQFTVLHETMGHYGLAGVLGDRLDATMLGIYRSNETVRELADRWMAANPKTEEQTADAYTSLAAEEALSDLAGTGMVREQGFWRWLMATIRHALRAAGLNVKVSDADIASLLASSRKFIEGGASEAVNGKLVPAMHRPPNAAEDVAPKLSRGFDVRELAPELQAKVNDLLKTQRKFNWWHRTIGTQYHKAEINREFKPVFNAAQRFVQDVSLIATEAADQAPALLPKLESLTQTAKDFFDVKGTRDHQADVKAVAAPVFQGTLKDNKVYTRDELGTEFKLTERQKDLYEQFRASVDQSLNSLAVSEMGQLAKPYGVLAPDLGHAIEEAKGKTPVEALGIFRQHLQDLARSQPEAYQREISKSLNTLEEVVTRVERLKQEGYAPLMRFGQHYVYFWTKTRDGRETQYFALHENERDANADFRRMNEEFPDAKVERQQGVLSQESYKLFKGVSPETLALFADALGAGEDVAKQAFLRLAISQRSALKRMIHRKGVMGFSDDVSRTLASFITSNARLASKNYHMGDLKQAAEAVHAGDVKDDAIALQRYLEDPQEEAAKFRGFLFAQFLGGSAASALVNATQPITMSFPYLTQFASAKDSAAGLMRGAQVALGRGKVDDETAAAMQKAAEEGVTEPAEIHQLYAESIRGLGSNIYMRRFFRLWGSAFQLAEAFNRKTTFAAAFEIGRTMRAKEGKSIDPYAFAVKAVHETQGIYNRANRPNWARGSIGATIFTFKQFSVAYLEFVKRLPPKQQAIALAILMLAAGLQGLPGAEDLDDIIDTIAEALGYNFSAEKAKHEFIAESLGLGKGVADWVMYGGSSLPGMPLDVQARMGLGNLVPGTGLFKKSTKDKTRDTLEVFGPTGGLIQSAMDAFAALEGGRYGAAAQAAAPVAGRNVLQAADMAQEGAYRDARGRRVVATDAADAAVKAIGFQPADVANAQRSMGRAIQGVQLTRVTEGEIGALWAEGMFERDPAKVLRARERLAEWNAKNPESPIRIEPSQIFRRVREMTMLREQRVIKSAPKETRGELVKDLKR